MMKYFLTTTVAFAALSTAAAQSPRAAHEGDWVSATGTVDRVAEESFWLDYGEGQIEVEFDGLFRDYDVDEKLRRGERVTVYGYADDEWFEGKTIEAESVYSEDRATYFQGLSDAGPLVYPSVSADRAGARVSFNGTVQTINGREFVLDRGATTIVVDTAGMRSNPLDASGYPQLSQGDHVMVSGRLERTLFDNRELRAENIYSVEIGTTAEDASTVSSDSTRADNLDDIAAMSDLDSDDPSPRAGLSKDAVDAQRNSGTNAPNAGVTSADQKGAKNPVFAAIDKNGNGEISQSEYVEFASKSANISRQEAVAFFSATARTDAKIMPSELFSPSARIDQVSDKVTDRN